MRSFSFKHFQASLIQESYQHFYRALFEQEDKIWRTFSCFLKYNPPQFDQILMSMIPVKNLNQPRFKKFRINQMNHKFNLANLSMRKPIVKLLTICNRPWAFYLVNKLMKPRNLDLSIDFTVMKIVIPFWYRDLSIFSEI